LQCFVDVDSDDNLKVVHNSFLPALDCLQEREEKGRIYGEMHQRRRFGTTTRDRSAPEEWSSASRETLDEDVPGLHS
jgi:hypothetical protein